LKQYLPFNVLLILALAAAGAFFAYNAVARGGFETVLLHDRPAVTQTEPPTVQKTEPKTEPPTEPETEPETEPPTEPETEPETIPAPTEPTEPAAPASVQFPLDLNTATAEEIKFIPGVGDTMSRRIVQYRDHIGGAYEDLAKLKNISGVGDATYLKLWSYFTIGGEDALAE
jgi:competence ComEA-like helix-hairpin-helix protein